MDKIKRNFIKGLLAMFVAILCWSPAEIVGKLIYENGGTPMTVLQTRYIVSSFLFLVTIVLIKRTSIKIRRKDWGFLLLSSICFIISILGFWFGLANSTNIAVFVAIYFLYPAISAGASNLFLKEKFSKYTKTSLIVAFVGLLFSLGVLPKLNLTGTISLGSLLIFIAGLGMGGYIKSSQSLIKKYSMQTTLFWNFLSAMTVFLFMRNPAVLLTEINWSNIWYLLFVAIFISFVAYLSLMSAIKYLGASITGIVHMSRGGFTILFAFLVLHQTPTIGQIIGATLVFLSIYILRGNTKLENVKIQ